MASIHPTAIIDPAAELDTSVSIGPTGVGLTTSNLHDESGPVGRCEQILTVRPMPAAR